MREYLFRGKRVDTKEWIYGSLLQWPDGDCYICAPEIENEMSKVQVIPETVGQYTGRHDKNRNKIFEGDILLDQYPDWEYEHGERKEVIEKLYYPIIFKDGCFGWLGENTGEFMSFSDYPLSDNEIIGTIHDNTEH